MLHIWGLLLYALDTKISNGKNITHWKNNSMFCVFLGYSPTHSSDVPLVLNLATGHIFPHYNMVLDDTFSTIQSISDG